MRRLISWVLALSLALMSGCSGGPTEMERTIFAMDTVMTLTFYGQDSEETLRGTMDDLVSAVYGLQNTLSVSDEGSEIWALNRDGQAELSPGTADLLARALELCGTTGGALDITARPAMAAWGFTTDAHRVPGEAELAKLAARIDYTQVELDGVSAALPAGVELDLGAVAKGYAGDLLAEQLRETSVSSALLDLGQSTIVAVGVRPDGKPWRIGIQDPAGEDFLGVLEVEDMAMGTSGGYQRYFEEDGVRYWHILDPDTAAPARSGLASVTVVAPSALLCDGLSTALFVMGLEEGTQFWRDHPELNFEAMFVTEDGALAVTAGLAERFAPADSGRELTVLE